MFNEHTGDVKAVEYPKNTGKEFFYKKFSLGLFLDTSIRGFTQFLDDFEDFIANIYFSLPMGDKFHSRRKVVDQFHDSREIDKFWQLLHIIQERNIRLELLFNTQNITAEEIRSAHRLLEQHGIRPDLVGLQDQYYDIIRQEFPSCQLVYSFNNAPHSHRDFSAGGHHYDEYVIGRNFIRDTELYDYIHWELGGRTVLLVNNGCSFLCGGCKDTQHCRNMYLKGRETKSPAELYALQSIMPFELQEGWLDLGQIDLIKINSRNSDLNYARNCLASYIFGHEEEWLSLNPQHFSLWAHLTWHFPYFSSFSYTEIRHLKLEIYNNRKSPHRNKLLCYSKDNVQNLYLSPYADYKRYSNRVLFQNQLYLRTVTVPLAAEHQGTLFAMLSRGCTQNDLTGFFSLHKLGDELFEELLQGCIIE